MELITNIRKAIDYMEKHLTDKIGSLRCKEGCTGEAEDSDPASDKEGLMIWNI